MAEPGGSGSSAGNFSKEALDRLLMPPPPPRPPREASGKRSLTSEEAVTMAIDLTWKRWKSLKDEAERADDAALAGLLPEVVKLAGELRGMGVPDPDVYLPAGAAATDWGSIAEAVVSHPSDPRALALEDAQVALRTAEVIAQVADGKANEVLPTGTLLRRALGSLAAGSTPWEACLTTLAASGEAGQRAGDVLVAFLQADRPAAMLQNWDVQALTCCSDALERSALDILSKVLTECVPSPNPHQRRVAAWCLTQMTAFRRPPSYVSGGAVSALTAVKRSAVRQELAAVLETL